MARCSMRVTSVCTRSTSGWAPCPTAYRARTTTSICCQQLPLLGRQRLEFTGEQQAVVGTPHAALEGEPRPRERRLDLAGLAGGEARP